MRYRVTYERDEDGWWIARLHGVPGVHSNGRTVRDAQRRVREALALAVGDAAAKGARFENDVRLPEEARRMLEAATQARAQAEAQAAIAQSSTSKAIAALVRRGLSVRDVGDLLGVSHQRVQQLKRIPERGTRVLRTPSARPVPRSLRSPRVPPARRR